MSSQRHLIAPERGLRSSHPAGIVLIVVIVCLGLAAAILGSFVAIALSGRELLHAECSQLQAQWLAESAIERAAALLAANPNYSGEQWNLSAEQLGAAEGGAVTIHVESVPDQSSLRLVHVQADYPDDPTYRCRQTKQATVKLPR